MKKFLLISVAVLFCFSQTAPAQIPTNVLAQIARAEDERRYDKTLENLLTSPDEKIRARAALAAGRIGDERSIPALVNLLDNDSSDEIRAAAAFAVGEIESAKGADAILKTLGNEKNSAAVRARAVEAAGKIAAAIATADKKKAEEIGRAILDGIESEARQPTPDKQLILLGLTAILRARPAGGDSVAAKFLAHREAPVRADAANTLARLRSKNHNEPLREMLVSDADAVARATAARALGIAEDKTALTILLKAATEDEDSRVRVSAMRALGSLKDKKVAAPLLEYANTLLDAYTLAKKKNANPAQKNELLEIGAALGRILAQSNDENAVRFLQDFRELDKFQSPETEIAFARVAPEKYLAEFKAKNNGYTDWRIASAYGQGLGDFGTSEDISLKARAGRTLTSYVSGMLTSVKSAYEVEMTKAIPDLLRALAVLKPDNLDEILRGMLDNPDVFIRATAAELIAERPFSDENFKALEKAFTRGLLTDTDYNDAQLAVMDALFKLDRGNSTGNLLVALNSKDYIVRKKAFELLRTKDLEKEKPGIPTMLEAAASSGKERVLPYGYGSRLGQILNAPADYTRAVSRKNGQVKAVVTTEKGSFAIDFFPEDAPLAVDNFIRLARARYYNNVSIHRVVPNFVMQDGDPRGDGNGGPGWQIRCEINTIPYERGAVGMALSGKDTGGSQWFVTHSRQPHLEGGYTVFGKVNEADMKIVDNLARGDKILSVKITEGNPPSRNPRRKPAR
ncbi:MAG TPA: HEAT repeat domain-containing protein [Pyrinomonadaceae bacterium]|nr:HEAT repeat domain-containing protein [Pyrinomonadaceae bacterium]